jgi:DNA-binding LacI/PurR family transcriptional regulator
MGYRRNTVSRPARAGSRTAGRLAAALRKAIRAGRQEPGALLPSVREISRREKLSCKTVHRALRALASEGLVAAEPARGYRVLHRANDPSRGCPVAYVLSAENIVGSWDLLYRQIGERLGEAAGRRGWTVASLVSRAGQEEPLAGQLKDLRAAGVVLDSHSPALVERVIAMGLPAVMVDAASPAGELDVVLQDNFGGAAAAAEHLLAKGHRRIAWLGPFSDAPHGRERYGGAAAALKAAGTEFSHQVDFPLDPAATGVARRFLEGKARPTGVLALWRPAAAALLAAARELGLVPGRDFEMVGWCAEEIYAKGYLDLFAGAPAAPAVVWSAAAMAEAAVERLAARRERPDAAALQIRIPARLRLPGSGGREA